MLLFVHGESSWWHSTWVYYKHLHKALELMHDSMKTNEIDKRMACGLVTGKLTVWLHFFLSYILAIKMPCRYFNGQEQSLTQLLQSS